MSNLIGQSPHQSSTQGSPPILSKARTAWLKWVALLLVIVLLGSLGSSTIFATGNEATPAPTVIQESTPSGGQAEALPAGWIDSGRGWAEFFEAEEVAERFTMSYESLDWRSKNTFVDATFMLTPSALARFNQQDERASATFITQFQQAEKVLWAQIDTNETQILQTQQRSDAFFAWTHVEFNLFHQQKDKPVCTDTHSIVVLLMSVPFDSNHVGGGVGWLVTDWKEGTSMFPIPQPAY